VIYLGFIGCHKFARHSARYQAVRIPVEGDNLIPRPIKIDADNFSERLRYFLLASWRSSLHALVKREIGAATICSFNSKAGKFRAQSALPKSDRHRIPLSACIRDVAPTALRDVGRRRRKPDRH